MIRRSVVLAGLLLAPMLPVMANDGVDKPAAPQEYPVRLGNEMREIAYRFSNAYWAANGGNWGLAQYQLNALREAIEGAEAKTPQKAQVLKNFEQAFSTPLQRAIQDRNRDRFNREFSAAIDGCNDCHTRQGRGFLRYQIPQAGETGSFLDFTAKTEPRPEVVKP